MRLDPATLTQLGNVHRQAADSLEDMLGQAPGGSDLGPMATRVFEALKVAGDATRDAALVHRHTTAALDALVADAEQTEDQVADRFRGAP